MYERSHVREGMTVRSMDGEKLGKVFAVQDGEFLIEKGLFFPKDYVCRYSEISDIRDGEIILLHGQESLRNFSFDEDRGVLADTSGTAGLGRAAVSSADMTTGLPLDTSSAGLTANAPARGVERPMVGKDTVTVPVNKEELDVNKRERQVGEVRMHKEVVQEGKEFTVPVRRERVSVERRGVKDRPAMHASFQEEPVVVPLRAEEVEVQKRPVVDEEVVIRKDAIEEERRMAETVRREDVSIRGDGDVDKRSLNLTDDDPKLRRS
jgi:uncharacterized protein (TIGR02271 family)